MNPAILILVSSDPLTSRRPAEAFRLAAGLAPWGKVEVSLFLQAAVLKRLSDHWDQVDGFAMMQQYLPECADAGCGLFGESDQDQDLVVRGDHPPVTVRAMGMPDLAQLAGQCRAVLSF